MWRGRRVAHVADEQVVVAADREVRERHRVVVGRSVIDHEHVARRAVPDFVGRLCRVEQFELFRDAQPETVVVDRDQSRQLLSPVIQLELEEHVLDLGPPVYRVDVDPRLTVGAREILGPDAQGADVIAQSFVDHFQSILERGVLVADAVHCSDGRRRDAFVAKGQVRQAFEVDVGQGFVVPTADALQHSHVLALAIVAEHAHGGVVVVVVVVVLFVVFVVQARRYDVAVLHDIVSVVVVVPLVVLFVPVPFPVSVPVSVPAPAPVVPAVVADTALGGGAGAVGGSDGGIGGGGGGGRRRHIVLLLHWEKTASIPM